jgi:16S rRNA (cytosine967-C5)-methyltransferase
MKSSSNNNSPGNSDINSREWAWNILNRQEKTQSYINILLDAEFQKYSAEPGIKAFTTEIVYGVMRNKRYLDWVIDSLRRDTSIPLPIPIRNLLRIGVYQILMMNSVPDFAAVNETVTLAEKMHFFSQKGFINGILRNVIRKRDASALGVNITDKVRQLGIQYSHPDWIVKTYLQNLGTTNCRKMLEANNTIPPVYLRVNTLKTTTKAFLESLTNKEVPFQRSVFLDDAIEIKQGFPLRELPGYQEGLFYVQDVAAQMIAYCLAPAPGSRVMDLCAAPGGKTFVLAQLMNNQGSIQAFDIHEGRINMLKEQASKLGCSIIESQVLDLSGVIPAKLHNSVDYILADVPCSGLGVLRRKLDARWVKKPFRIQELAKIQEKILDNAAACLKPGGALVYSTCTLTMEENDFQVKIFLSKHPEFELESLKNILPEKNQFLVTEAGCLKTLPYRDNLDGMFASRLVKRK